MSEEGRTTEEEELEAQLREKGWAVKSEGFDADLGHHRLELLHRDTNRTISSRGSSRYNALRAALVQT